MQQVIKAEILINIPPDQILISKVEYEELQSNLLIGVYWSMKDLEQRINKKHEWIKANILYPSRFRRILDVKNGGFVYYPKSKGEKWSFQATKMSQFLEDNFHTIFKG